MSTAIRVVYAVAIGVFVVLTVGFGAVTFAPGPERPEFPTGPRVVGVALPPDRDPSSTTDEERAAAEKQRAEDEEAKKAYDTAYESYRQERADHLRRVLVAVMLVAAALLVAGVTVGAAVDVLRIGMMIGGLFTALWGLAYAAEDAGSGTMFVVALVVLLVLGSLSSPALRHRLRRALRLGPADDLLSG